MTGSVTIHQGIDGAGTLVIVHADEAVVGTLSQLLSDRGYTLKVTDQGASLRATLETGAIDLILLGSPLTDEDSYALCQSLKEAPETRDIPIVLVGLGNHWNVTRAFEAGANDYLSPPFFGDEVNARVSNQLNTYWRRRQLSQQNALLLQEVLERKQVEEALRKAETKYRSIFENATEGIFQTSEAGRYISVNPAMAKIYGYDSPDDLVTTVTNIGKQLYVQPQRRDELVAYLRKFGQIVGAESEVYRKDGTQIWVSETIHKVCDDSDGFLYYEGIVHDITERRSMEMELRQQRKQADRLLVNILPYQIAQRLKSGVRTIAESLDEVSVLFADLVDFTAASSQMSPKQLVELLSEVFSAFDRLAEKHQIEKIKTIGDAYMAAGGLLAQSYDHISEIALMALDMQQAMKSFLRPDGKPFQLRVGINTGPAIAGVIGMRKFAYDLWGDTVNLASRMETTGEAGRIQVTPEVYHALKNRFVFESRGAVAIKGRGSMETYWLVGKRSR